MTILALIKKENFALHQCELKSANKIKNNYLDFSFFPLKEINPVAQTHFKNVFFMENGFGFSYDGTGQ